MIKSFLGIRSIGGVNVLKTILTIIYVIVCIALTVVVLMQEGKSAGLGAISGVAETYWGKNKGRSMEGALLKSTNVLAGSFIILSFLLNYIK